MGNIVIVCKGGCGKTTDKVSPEYFWKGKVEQVDGTLVPAWTCKECVEKSKAAQHMRFSPGISGIAWQHKD